MRKALKNDVLLNKYLNFLNYQIFLRTRKNYFKFLQNFVSFFNIFLKLFQSIF